MDFHKLCTFEFFAKVSPQYGYGADFEEMVQKEFSRSKGVTYLDHAAATLFPESALTNYCRDISSSLYGNPHSRSLSSRLAHDTVERVRGRILQHFDADPDEYSVIFTSGCTAALKLVAESFPWTRGSVFSHLTDSHTSVVGIRGLTAGLGVTTLPVSPENLQNKDNTSDTSNDTGDLSCQTPHLFCYPAQSNFSGKKYPLSYVSDIQTRAMYPASAYKGRWFVLLDAASHACSSPLNLKQCQADFIPISFYKILGFPTGLGALLVRRGAAAVLRKSYFGGGTAAAYLSGENYYVPVKSTSDRFEDGTVSFLDIVALSHGFDTFYKLTGGMQSVQQHTFGLARFTYLVLSSLRHSSGAAVARVYAQDQFRAPGSQGPILNFNLLDSHGEVIGYAQVERMASLFNIHVRTGCFCNTGACQDALGISNEDVKANLQAGHVCGDDVDLVLGRPTGSVRVSFGYMSTFEDCRSFLRFVTECFVEGEATVDRERIEELTKTSLRPIAGHDGEIQEVRREEDRRRREGAKERRSEQAGEATEEECSLTNIYVYPVKSCASFEVRQWPLGAHGLLYDRGWMVVNVNGVCLSQKREPRLCLIRPEVQLQRDTLLLRAPDTVNFDSDQEGDQEGDLEDSLEHGDTTKEADLNTSQEADTDVNASQDTVTSTQGSADKRKHTMRLKGSKGMESLSVPLEANAQSQVCQSRVCGDRVETQDCGEAAADWLSDFLGQTCRLIRLNSGFTRDAKKKKRTKQQESSREDAASSPLSLVNEAQYLMINRTSAEHIHRIIHNRDDLTSDQNLFLDVDNVVSRFRANLVVSAATAFKEDEWSQLTITNTVFTVTGKCSRCHMVGINQETGDRTMEPLRTLSVYRDQGKVTFGVYLSHQLPQDSSRTTVLRVGSRVQPQTISSPGPDPV